MLHAIPNMYIRLTLINGMLKTVLFNVLFKSKFHNSFLSHFFEALLPIRYIWHIWHKRCTIIFFLVVFGVGVSCRDMYSFVVYVCVNGSITLVGEERANLSAVAYL